jgi:hypothetical protein
MYLKKLPDELIIKIRKYFYSYMTYQKKRLNNELLSFILEEDDIGSTIIYRIQGMPKLEKGINED